MLLNRIKKLIVIALCALFILPAFNVKLNDVNASEYDATLYVGLNYEYEIEESAIKNASLENIIISAKKDGGEFVEIFKDKKDVEGDKFKVSYSSAKLTLLAREAGVYEIKVAIKDSETDSYSININVIDEIDREALKPQYSYTEDDMKEFTDGILQNIKSDDSETGTLVAGDEFKLPSLKKLIKTVVPYESLKKTLYYAVPNGTSYQTTTFTRADASFKVSAYGTYRLYVTMYVEKTDKFEDGILLGTEFLEEKVDGFYAIYDLEDNKLFAKKVNNEYKYYTDEECENEYTGEVKTSTSPIIPIFTFKLENAGPSIKIESNYQENGYVGLEYTVDDISINGTDTQTNYKLQYSNDDGKTWQDAEEEFNSEKLTFTPSKIGKYKVVITASDATNKTVINDDYIISVDEKYTTVKYKVGFGEWLKVNVVPFICLCISGVCLIAIILLLVIKPKDKSKEVLEEDR